MRTIGSRIAWIFPAFLAVTAGCGAAHAPLATARVGGAQWSYDITPIDGATTLDVRATFPGGVLDPPTELSVTEGAEPFVRELSSTSGPVSTRGAAWTVPSCANGCTLHYRFALREACEELRDDAVANGDTRALQSPAGAWLLRPMSLRDGDSFRLTMHGSEGGGFASGLRSKTTGPITTIEGPAIEIGRSPYAMFGPVRSLPVKVTGATLTLAISDSKRAASDEALVAWAHRSSDALTKTFGHFPIDGALIGILPARRARHGRVGFGRATAGGLGASILIDVGADVDEAALRGDWVLVHEMIHLAFPSLDRTHRWMEEGLATYLEPLLRARAGIVEPRDVWTDYVNMMHNGLPEEGDRGLDVTRTWGRLYWGGALFCFVADVTIRTRTHGARSLDDALRAILDAGGNNGAQWTIERTFAVGDAATGVDVLTSMYASWKATPVDVDLPKMFSELGVHGGNRGVPLTFDDAAPLAAVRRAMTTP